MTDARDNAERVRALIRRGVDVPHPETVSIGETVDLDRIATEGVVIHGGVRLDGATTFVGRGARIGDEGPATVVDCQLASGVKLKGGSFRESTFLAGASLGVGAHIREGCLLEEQASGAHTVGLKQTILFPYVTLGSLANFCDCLMAGGTNRKNHSEVGSSYIHFNFTPHQDKATPSLFGDVPRGVMLVEPPVFLGGQGGTVGPVRLGFGTVVAAGTIVRKDHVEGNTLITDPPPRADAASSGAPFVQGCYRSIARRVRNNVIYVGNLHALAQWYEHVRRRYTGADETPVLDGALARLESAVAERVKRIRALADKMPASVAMAAEAGVRAESIAQQRALGERGAAFADALAARPNDAVGAAERDAFLDALPDADYLEAMPGVPEASRAAGTAWLDAIVSATMTAAASVLPEFGITT